MEPSMVADGGFGGHPQDMLGHFGRVMQDGSGERAGDEGAVGVVGAVREGFGNGAEPGLLCEAQHFRAGQAKDGQAGVHGLHGVDDGARLGGVR